MAHSGPISSMIFIEEGQKLVTAGVEDGLITLWKVTYDTEEADPSVSGWYGREGNSRVPIVWYQYY